MYLSSTFSIQMLPPAVQSTILVEPIGLEEAKRIAKFPLDNIVNPRHESTAKLSEYLCGKPAKGGFLTLEAGTREEILVMLPPRSAMSRSGAEIEIEDLKDCQFFLVRVKS